MRVILAVIMAISSTAAAASYPFHVVVDKTGAEAKIIAVNAGHAPVTIAIDIPATADDRKNIRFEDLPSTSKKSVVNARTKSTLLTLRPASADQPYSFRYTFRWTFGDERAKHDEHARYRLPFPDGMKSRMESSLDRRHSKPEYQFDMDMILPEWTPILAARAGVVFDVRGYHEGEVVKNGAAPSNEVDAGIDLGDLVRILHDDGSFAEYSNLMPSSVLVKPGQRIEAGTRIAFAGTSGEATKAYLHFGVYALTAYHQIQSVPWFFYTKDKPQLRPFPGDELLADYTLPSAPEEQPAPHTKRSMRVEEFSTVLKRPISRPEKALTDDEVANEAQEKHHTANLTKYVWIAVLLVAVGYIVYARRQATQKKTTSDVKGAE